MAYVVPSGTIQLMKGVRLDNRYAHTIYFADIAAQNTYFTSKVVTTFSNQYYTRHNANTIRVKALCDTIADCSYLRFQNRPNGKWYYCFINAVNYINEGVTEIIFEIDVMQTWFFQTGHDIKPCYIDREHVSSDSFGIYHAPEAVHTDEYAYHWIKDTQLFDNYDLIVQTSQEPSAGFMFDNNTYAGCKIMRLTVNDESTAAAAAALIQTALGGSWDKNEQSANMVDMFEFPSNFAHQSVNENVYQVTLSKPTVFSYSDGDYAPKNNRLFSNPYCSLLVTDYKGDNATYEWEQFTDPSSIAFTLRGNLMGGGTIICYPNGYAGLTSNFDCGLLINNFPKRAYSYDSYSAWVASGGMTRLNEQKNLVHMQGMARTMETVGDMFMVTKKAADTVTATEIAAATGGLATSVAVSQAAGAGQAISQASANTISRQAAQREAQNNITYEFNDAKYSPDVVFGSISADIAVSHRILDFNFISMYPKKDEAIRIDDFFSTYGYSIKEVKTPNITGRKHWNFLKTKGCVIGGDMPSTSRQAICDIIDSGIFFWKNGDEIGNFRVEVTDGSINNPIQS